MDWSQISKLSTAVIALGILVWALDQWHDERMYNAETERANREKMAAVISGSLIAAREDRSKVIKLSNSLMAELRDAERADAEIIRALHEIISLIKKDRAELKKDLAEIVESLDIQTKSIKRRSN